MKLPLSKQITLALIVGGVAFLTSFLLGLLRSAAAAHSGLDEPYPSPLIGLSLGVVAGGMYLALSGNRRVAIADAGAREAALRPVSDGTARLIVYREGFVGKLAGIDVLVDGAVRTQLKSPRFAVLDIAPGARTIESKVQGKRSRPLAIDVAPNETAVVQLVMTLGKGSQPVQRQDVAAVRASLARVPMVAG